MLERRLFRRKSTGEVIDPTWLEFSFPTWWHYDVLRGLDYLRDAGVDRRRAGRRGDRRRRGQPRARRPVAAPERPRGRVALRDGRRRGPAQPLEHAHRDARARLGRAERVGAAPGTWSRRPGLTRRATVWGAAALRFTRKERDGSTHVQPEGDHLLARHEAPCARSISASSPTSTPVRPPSPSDSSSPPAPSITSAASTPAPPRPTRSSSSANAASPSGPRSPRSSSATSRSTSSTRPATPTSSPRSNASSASSTARSSSSRRSRASSRRRRCCSARSSGSASRR